MRIIVVLALLLAGCEALEADNRADSADALAAELGWRADAFVAGAGSTAYASRLRDGGLEFMQLQQNGQEWYATGGGSWVEIGETNTVLTAEGIRGGTVIYGSAEPGVAQVVTDAPDAVGGVLIDGGWTIWTPDESLTEADDAFTWRFVDADGNVMEEGSGWQWPFGDPFDPAPSF